MSFTQNEESAALDEDGLPIDLNAEPGTEEADHPYSSSTTPQRSTVKGLTCEQKMNILLQLLGRATEGRLQHGSINVVAQEYNVSRRCISSIWKIAKEQKSANQRYNVTTKMHNAGRKQIRVEADAIKSLSMGQRSCIRDLAANLYMSKSTVHRMVKRGIIKPHSNSLHPGLNEETKLKRLKWILGLLKATGETKEYHSMYDYIHLDEKWFYLTKKTQKVYLARDEKGKYRLASSSKFIPKVMFTAAVARPRFNLEGQCTFDGKIGIFPFTYTEAAKRSSKNRTKGTLVTKTVKSVNQHVTRSMPINDIIPAIKTKWPPSEAPKVIFIQQDNAKAHINQRDAEWQQIYEQDGFTFILNQQPPNSPDMNILDLGFFRSIQSLMHKKMPTGVDDMLEAVNEAFYELHPKTLSNVWMSLQYVMNEILKVKGGNDYDLPHVNKERLETQGNLQREIKAPMWAVTQAWETIYGGGQQTEIRQQTTTFQPTIVTTNQSEVCQEAASSSRY